MNFTREPIIETVITPKEGFKLVIRNSKGGGQEEFFVDAVEVISFGNTSFFRSLEKPKSFLVPVNDYEILEVREARMVLKTGGIDKSIKIAGGRETALKVVKEETPIAEVEAQAIAEQKADKRRERRKYRKKRGKSEQEESQETVSSKNEEEKKEEKRSLIPPPSTLISETIERKKDPKNSVEESIVLQEKDAIIPPPPPIIELEEKEEAAKDEEIPF